MQTRSKTRTGPKLCWDIYSLIAQYDWKLIPKLMQTCRTLYNRLKPQLNIVAATIAPTLHEQLKYVREVLLPNMMQDHDVDWFGHNLCKLRCNPVHLKVGITSWACWLDFIDSDGNRLHGIEGKENEFIEASIVEIKKYLETGYQLLFWDRIKCLQWRPIMDQQKEDIVMRLFYRDLHTLLGCNVKEYLIKHPILDTNTNRNVHIYLDPDYTAIEDNLDAYYSVLYFLHNFYYTSEGLVGDPDVTKVLEKMTEPYWLLM
jgi:hypothetical protein